MNRRESFKAVAALALIPAAAPAASKLIPACDDGHSISVCDVGGPTTMTITDCPGGYPLVGCVLSVLSRDRQGFITSEERYEITDVVHNYDDGTVELALRQRGGGWCVNETP